MGFSVHTDLIVGISLEDLYKYNSTTKEFDEYDRKGNKTVVLNLCKTNNFKVFIT